MAFILEFPLSVIEKLDYYVYLLIDPKNNQVFYVAAFQQSFLSLPRLV